LFEESIFLKRLGLPNCHGSSLNEEGEVYQVQCKICTFVKGKQKIKTPKLDNLLKHQEHRKAKVSMPNVDVYTFYSNKNSIHVQSEDN
jgi:hypothetical protein